MESFKISRIHTKLGIFRLSGIFNNEVDHANISYISAEFMGTDGWCELDLQSKHTQSVLRNIQIEVLQHLT
ncbi:Aminomethyltransferase folate-binding domain-containing protein [Vibrio cholerae]